MLQARASGLPRPGGDAADAARTIALQMLEERGRGAVLVGVARVDAVLESLLQAVLRPAPGATDTFFQPERPLGSFEPCITLAARLGVIDPLVEQTLRRVRNAFAHSTTTATLAALVDAGGCHGQLSELPEGDAAVAADSEVAAVDGPPGE